MSGLNAVGLLLIPLFFSFIISSLWLRIALVYWRVSGLQHVNQIIYKFTDPLIKPVDFLVKPKHRAGRSYDLPALLVLIVIELLKIISLGLLALHTLIPGKYLYSLSTG